MCNAVLNVLIIIQFDKTSFQAASTTKMHPSCFIYGSVFVSNELKSLWHQKHYHILLTAHKYCRLQRPEPLFFGQYNALVVFCNLLRDSNAVMLGNECRPPYVDTAETRVRLSQVTFKIQSVPRSKRTVFVIKPVS
jgi:hypothetical protein